VHLLRPDELEPARGTTSGQLAPSAPVKIIFSPLLNCAVVVNDARCLVVSSLNLFVESHLAREASRAEKPIVYV
jgi:hypothetical protein